LNGVANSLGIKPKGEGVKTLIETFRYPRRGPGMMWDAAAAKILTQGGSVLMDRAMQTAAWDDRSRMWTVVATDGQGGRHVFTARHLISSAPIAELSQSLSPTPISRLHARDLRYRDFLTVALIARNSSVFPDNWI